MNVTDQKITACFKKNPFLNYMGFEILDCQEENILLKLSITKDHLNIQQNLHGGVHASMLDTVQSLALRSFYHAPVSVLNINVHYLAPTSSGNLFAHARIIQKGYKTSTVESEIFNEKNELIAKGSGVYKIVRDTAGQT